MEIAVLLTTFNRKEKTTTCLKSLFNQKKDDGVSLSVFLTDDGSKDSTAEAVQAQFPVVQVFHGSGSLFWAGGMRNSWREARKSNPDFYLLINDDTVLQENTIATLLDTYENAKNRYGKAAVCIGSTADNETGKTSYGGRTLISPEKIHSTLVENNTQMAECDLGNANIMLVPKEIVETIGILSDAYTHGIADYDYTLTAKKHGFAVVVAPGMLGVCQDDHGNNWKGQNTSLKERIQYLYSPKGLAYKEYLYFIKKHFPTHYNASITKLWLKTLFPFLWDTLKK